MTGDLDVPSLDMLDELFEELDRSGMRLILARVHAEARAGLERSGLVMRIGEDGIQARVNDAVRVGIRGGPPGSEVS